MPAIEGQQEIRKFLDGYPQITNFGFHLVDLHGDGQLAYMRAKYNITFVVADTTKVSDVGKILVILKKQPDGSWVRVADAWNSDLPPTN
jgi:ketosteroid isomerase-like protein